MHTLSRLVVKNTRETILMSGLGFLSSPRSALNDGRYDFSFNLFKLKTRRLFPCIKLFFAAFSLWVPRRRPDLRNWPNGTSCATTKRWWAMSHPGELQREAEERRSLRTHLPPRDPRNFLRIPLQNKLRTGRHERKFQHLLFFVPQICIFYLLLGKTSWSESSKSRIWHWRHC